MASIANQVVEQFTQIPGVSLEHPYEAVGILVATAAAMTGVHLRYNHTEEQVVVDLPNAGLLQTVATRTPRQIRRSRLGPTQNLLLGTGLAAAALAGHPTFESASSTSNATAIVVEDVSYSMGRTSDLGRPNASRKAVAEQAVETTTFPGSLGVIHAAPDKQPPQVAVSPSPTWRKHTAEIAKLDVDPNGSVLQPALQLAESLLPPSKKTAGGHEGTVLIISDGTVDDAPEALGKQIATMLHSGLKVKVIVPGTTAGTFAINPTAPIKSSEVKPQVFAGAGVQNVEQAQTADEVTTAVHQELTAASNTTSKHNWELPLLAGLATFAAGLARTARNVTGRYV